MKDTNTIRFFKELAQRMYKENDLSDIVYALCESNLQFKQFFLDFFFGDRKLVATNAIIEREVQYECGSRPDFVIRYLNDNEENVFFVENKIWDGSHHFAQYASTEYEKDKKLGKNNLGYIANYKIKKEDLSKEDDDAYPDNPEQRIKTWRQFREELANKAEDVNEQSWATSEDIQGFLAYCEEICPDFEEEQGKPILNSDVFEQVKGFYESIGKVLDNREIKVGCKCVKIAAYNRGGFNKPSEWMGRYFEASGLIESKTVWGWIGCYFARSAKTPGGLCIEFQNKSGWGKPIFDELPKKKEKYQIDYCYDISNLSNMTSGEIVDFVMNAIKSTFESILRKEVPPVDTPKTPDSICNMRRLPLFLQQQIITSLQLDNAHIEMVTGSDSSKPHGWCGVYFDVVATQAAFGQDKTQENKENRERGWLGTYFDGREITILNKEVKKADGSWLVLEYNGKSYLVADTGALNAKDIRENIENIFAIINQSGKKDVS